MTNDIKVSDNELKIALLGLGLNMELTRTILDNRPLFERYGINTANRWASFLGQCAHESMFFSAFSENLYYRAETICRVWPSRFKTVNAAKPYAKNPRALANKVYSNRMGNDNKGDGYLYRGRGAIQLTGKNNYLAAGTFLKADLVSSPELVENNVLLALLTAVWYFTKTKYRKKTILEWADTRSHKAVTKTINGGTHGLPERILNTNYVLSTLTKDEGLYKLPVLRVGAKGNGVKVMQNCLKSLGFKVVKIDGKYGKRTSLAIRSFQAANNLVVDGIVGGKTYALLITLASEE